MTNLRIEDHCWHIILNTNANEKKCERNWMPVAELLERRNINHELHVVRNPGEGVATAKSLCQSGIRHIVAAGGDGTINEVVNGIFTAGIDTREVWMAVLPLGRGNDWVRTHNYPKTIAEVVEAWRDGNFIQHDIGKVTSRTNGKNYSRYFINIAGFGFDADVIYDVTHNPPHLFGLKVIAAICQYNGGGIREAKYAVPDDGLLDLIVIPKMSIPKVLKHLKDMTSGNHIDTIEGIRMIQTTQADLTSDDLFRGEVEGELLRPGNYHIELIPNALNVLTAR